MANISRANNEITETSNILRDRAHVTTKEVQEEPKPARRLSLLVDQSSKRISESSDSGNVSHTSTIRCQPSKAFLTKCWSELKILLDKVKESYHTDLKAVQNDRSYTDFEICLEGIFRKSVHRCVIATRVFKFHSTLGLFQAHFVKTDQNIDAVILGSKKTEVDTICNLPKDILTPGSLEDFLNRAYTDTDLIEQEHVINQKLLDWLKTQKPNLARKFTRISPDPRESFRTLQPDFESLTISSGTPDMSKEYHQEVSNEDIGLADKEASRSNSTRDESLTGLTRAETFELVTKDRDKEANSTRPDDEKSELSASDTSASSFAPVTRTGLKPKKFTTPVGQRSVSKSSTPNSTKSANKIVDRDSTIKQKPPITPVTRTSLTKQAHSKTNPTQVVAKKLSPVSTSSNSPAPQTRIALKSDTQSAGSVRTRNALVPRAQPISIERSQSPNTAVKLSTPKNFIEANKRYVAQLEKKTVMSPDLMTSDTDPGASELCNSVLDTITTDKIGNPQLDKFTLVSHSKLAEALSKMFLDEIYPDAMVSVRGGENISVHRAILSARSAYLADYISNPQVDETREADAKNLIKIDLSEFSHHSVYFCLMHIYSGMVQIPEDIDLDELTRLSHMLHVSSLREVCMHNLRMNYCHYFHKPCNTCCLGVLKTLPLAWRYDYTDLYAKCLQWIGSNFASIFCLKEFSELKPQDLIEECYNATMSQLTPDNVIPKTIECQKLLKNLPRVKWSESVICLVGRQLEDFCHYVADNYEKILQTESFLNLSKNFWECEVLEENLLAAMNHLKPESGCRTLIQLHKIECSNESYCEEPRNISDSFSNLISKMRKYCERYLLKEASAVVHCSSWRHMDPSLQKRIKDQAILSTDFDEPTKALSSKPKLPSMSRTLGTPNQSRASPDVARNTSSNRSTPESKIRSPSSTVLSPPKRKTAVARHVKVLK